MACILKTTRLGILILIVACALTGSKAFAANEAPKVDIPLLMSIRNGNYYNGDIWKWNGSELIARTGNGHNYYPIVAPTGDAFVYQRMPKAYIAFSNTNPSAANKLAPTDIYLMTLNTAQEIPLAVQPPDMSFSHDKSSYILRSQPTWSEDGTLIAWTEVKIDQTSETNPALQKESLMIYDRTAKTTYTAVPALPPHRATGSIPLLSEVSFGPKGIIAVKVRVAISAESSTEDRILFFDTKGQQIATANRIEKADRNYAWSEMIWLSGLDKTYLSCVACTTKIDPSTGKTDVLEGTPELFSPLAPDKLSMYLGADSGDEANVTWNIALNGKQVSSFDSVRISTLHDVAISPDGLSVAAANYVGQGTTAGVFIYQAQRNKIVKIRVNVLGINWGELAWRVRSK